MMADWKDKGWIVDWKECQMLKHQDVTRYKRAQVCYIRAQVSGIGGLKEGWKGIGRKFHALHTSANRREMSGIKNVCL